MGGKSKDPDYNRKYYQRNRDRLMQMERERYQTLRLDPEYKKAVKLRRELLHYGCSLESILAKSNGLCVVCGGKAVVAHHLDKDGRTIEKLGQEPGKDIDRLVGLCRRCHINEHRSDLLKARAKLASERWGRSHNGTVYDCCIDCGRNDVRYSGKGICINCVGKRKRQKTKQAGRV